MLSSTYQMGSPGQVPPDASGFYVGHEMRRLEAEAFRDAVLHVSGTLETTPPAGAPPLVKTQDPSPEDLSRNRAAYEQSPHRSIYLPVVRSHIYDLLTLLDFPNVTTPVGRRDTTTVPSQALLMLNNPFLIDMAERLARSVRLKPDPLGELNLRLFARPISAEERAWSEDFLQRLVARGNADNAWTLFCHLFDYKPKLEEYSGKPLPFAERKAQFAERGDVMASPWKFRRVGQSGLWMSDLWQHLPTVADELCMVHSVCETNVSHGGACMKLHTGDEALPRPSLGA